MNMATVLKMPLRATSAGSRCAMVVVMVLLLALATALQRYQPGAPPVWVPSLFSAFGQYLIGIGFLAPCLLLAIDAKQLRLPKVQYAIVLGMLFYSVLLIAIPSMILCIAGGPPSIVVAFQVLCLVIGVAGGVLPRAFIITTMLMPSLFISVLPRFHHPVSLVVTHLWVAAAVLVVAIAVAWWYQLRRANPYRLNFGTPLVVRTQRMARYGGAGWRIWDRSAENDERGTSQPAWKRAVADVRGSGPQYPRHSLRILLGGWLVPKTRHHALWLCMLVTLPITVFFVLLYLLFPEQLLDLWRAFPFYGIAWLFSLTSLFLGLFAATLMQQRWLKANAELSILALLPGLGRGPTLIKNLLQASLLPTLCLQLLLAVVLCIAAVLRHPNISDGLSAILEQITALAFAPAFALATLGGRALPGWVTGPAAGTTFVLLGIGTGVSAGVDASQVVDYSIAAFVLAGRLMVLAFLCWLGHRGWRGLVRRPHPFLPA
ncbi:hypothetical protein GCM10011408_04900 [Dyella caseinilytica]|nr:hypothetical protein GCM10011408_04900 [Dyella caseinilytica]